MACADGMCLLQLPGYPKRDEGEPSPYWSHRFSCRFYHVLAQIIDTDAQITDCVES